MKKILLSLLFVSLGVTGIVTAQTEALVDNSLELTGGGGTQWTSTSTNFGTVLCDVAGCGTCGGPCAPHTGSWYAWFGGTSSAEIGTLTQTFNVASGATSTLSFWLMIPNYGGATDSIAAFLDGTQVFYKAGTDSVGFDAAYAQVNLNLGMVTTGSHTLEFRGVSANALTYNVLVDDITLTVGGSASTETNMLDEGIRMVNDFNNHSLNMYFDFTEAMDLTISIIDMNGKIVEMQDFNQIQNGEYTFSTSELSTGVYSVYFRKGNNSSVGKKFYVQK
jgi:hypothetical protein